MIGFLEGTIFDVGTESLILKVNGVGYEVVVTPQTLSDAAVLMGQTISFWIYSHIKEDAFTLFGFLTKTEKDFFIQLLKVNGVGPKMALNVMSGGPTHLVQEWIERSDAKALSALPKVGKKTAEQIILTLQGKLVRIDSPAKAGSRGNFALNSVSENQRQIASALVNLGFKSQNVDQFIGTIDAHTTIEDGVRKGLQSLSGVRP